MRASSWKPNLVNVDDQMDVSKENISSEAMKFISDNLPHLDSKPNLLNADYPMDVRNENNCIQAEKCIGDNLSCPNGK